MKKFTVSTIYEAVNRSSKALGQIARDYANVHRQSRLVAMSWRQLNRRGADLGRQLRNVAGTAALAGGALGVAFKKGFLDIASSFERYETILGTIEGTSARAKQSMAWISDFAASTPFELDRVTEAFVKLRAFGLNARDGTLRVLGDTAAAMGKTLDQGVEALADAVTGEFERLKEFGVKAKVVNDLVVFNYSQAGKQMRKIAKLNNRQMVRDMLIAIFNDKYSGAMDKLSRTWDGMMSNLSDQWTRFAVMVMESGMFDLLKSRLEGLLTRLNAMAADGSLQQWANRVGDVMIRAFLALERLGKGFAEFAVPALRALRRVIRALGGLENAGVALGVLLGGKLAVTIVSVLIPAVKFLAAAFGVVAGAVAAVGAPIAVVIVALAALAAAIAANWETISATARDMSMAAVAKVRAVWSGLGDWFDGLWDRMFEGFDRAIAGVWDNLKSLVDYLPSALRRNLGFDTVRPPASPAASPPPTIANGRAPAPASAPPVNRSEVVVRLENAPAGTRVVQQKSRGATLDVDMGISFAGVSP